MTKRHLRAIVSSADTQKSVPTEDTQAAHSATGRAANNAHVSQERSAESSDEWSSLFGDVNDTLRMRMELIARAAKTPDRALPTIIKIVVEGSAEKHEKIVEAINNNAALRNQWERAWHELRQ